MAAHRIGHQNQAQAAAARTRRRSCRSRWAFLILAVVPAFGLPAAGCRPENKHYGVVSILCADAMRIYLKGQNVAQILQFTERADGMRSQIVFELKDLDDSTRQAAATCAFQHDDRKRMVLVGAALDGRALDTREITELSDLLLRGAH